MKLLSILLVAMLINSGKNENDNSDFLIFKNQLVYIYAEKAVFHSKASENFMLKFKIKNISNEVIGVDLTDYWKVLYPNQWGIYPKPQRDIIDERRIVPEPLTEAQKSIGWAKNKNLTLIKPQETLIYYRDWNGSGENVHLENKKEFLIVSIDGQMVIATQNNSMKISFDDIQEMAIEYPLIHANVPENALIVHKN